MSSRIFLVIGFLFCSTTLFCPPEDLPPEVSEYIENAKARLAEIFASKPEGPVSGTTIAELLRLDDEMCRNLAILKVNTAFMHLMVGLPDGLLQHKDAIFQALNAEIAEMGFAESVFNKIRFYRPLDQAMDLLPRPSMPAVASTLPSVAAASSSPMESALPTDLPSTERSPSEPPLIPVDEVARISLDEFIENAKKDLAAVFTKKIKPFSHTPKLSIEAYIRGDGNLKWGCGDFNSDLRIKKLRELPSQPDKYSNAEIYIIYHALNEEIIKKKFDFLSYTMLSFWSPDFGRIFSLTKEEYEERLKTLENSPNLQNPDTKIILSHPFRLKNIAAFVCLVAGGAGFLWSVLRKPKKDHKKPDHRSSKSKVPMVLFGGLFLGSAGFLVLTNR